MAEEAKHRAIAEAEAKKKAIEEEQAKEMFNAQNNPEIIKALSDAHKAMEEIQHKSLANIKRIKAESDKI